MPFLGSGEHQSQTTRDCETDWNAGERCGTKEGTILNEAKVHMAVGEEVAQYT